MKTKRFSTAVNSAKVFDDGGCMVARTGFRHPRSCFLPCDRRDNRDARPRVSRVSRVSRGVSRISFPRLGEGSRDVSPGFWFGIFAGQFAVRFHLGEQGAGFIRTAHDMRPLNVPRRDAIGIVCQ